MQQDISSLTICPCHRSELGLVENAAENEQGKKQFAKFRVLQIEEVRMFMLLIPFCYKDKSVLLENIPLIKLIKITSGT